MGQLNSLINTKMKLKAAVNTLMKIAQRNAYTNAISNAETLKNRTQTPELDKSVIQGAINNINTAINNLDGETKLAKAKQDAKATVNGLNSLTNAQK